MANHLKIEIKESREELEKRLQKETQANLKDRLRVLYWLKKRKVKTRKEIAELLGRDESTIYRWLRKYKQEGLEGLMRENKAKGQPKKIPDNVLYHLEQRLNNEKEGFTSYKQIQQWLQEKWGLKVAYSTVYNVVHYSKKAKLKVPRPSNPKANPEVQEEFKKKLPLMLQVIEELLAKGDKIRYWCQDESRFGTLTITGRKITAFGVKPIGEKKWGRANFYRYGIIDPLEGQYFDCELPKLNHEHFQEFLNQFSAAFPDCVNVVQLDRASFHIDDDLDWPENIIPIFQPSHSPELNPIERFWEYIKSFLRWENFSSLKDLSREIDKILENINPQEIISLCGWEFMTSALSSLST